MARATHIRPRLDPKRHVPWNPLNGEVGLRVLADLLAVFAGIYAAGLTEASAGSRVDIAVLLTPLWVLVFFVTGLYDPVRVESSADEARRVWHGVSLATATTIIASYWIALPLSRTWLLSMWAGGLGSVALDRAVVRFAVRRLRSRLFRRRVAIVGTDKGATDLAEAVLLEPGTGIEVIGFVSTSDLPTQELGSINELPQLVQRHRIDEVLVSPNIDGQTAGHVAQALGGLPVTVRLALSVDGFFPSRMAIHSLGSRALVALNPPNLHLYARIMKRAIDLCAGIALLLLLSPLMMMIAMLIEVESRGPVLFGHKRVGRKGRAIAAYKFRTMVADGGDAILRQHLATYPAAAIEWERTYKLRDDPRVTRIGRLLRKLSLDELPQLINVVRGDMSLVGPRPVVPDEVPRFGRYKDQILHLRPGMTGWWQVNGRNDISYEERARLELTYVRNWSIALDLLILLKTCRAMVRGEGH